MDELTEHVAHHVLETHRPTDDTSWQSCTRCDQGSRNAGSGEFYPSWPCDAVRLAMYVTGAGLPQPRVVLKPEPAIPPRPAKPPPGWVAPPNKPADLVPDLLPAKYASPAARGGHALRVELLAEIRQRHADKQSDRL